MILELEFGSDVTSMNIYICYHLQNLMNTSLNMISLSEYLSRNNYDLVE